MPEQELKMTEDMIISARKKQKLLQLQWEQSKTDPTKTKIVRDAVRVDYLKAKNEYDDLVVKHKTQLQSEKEKKKIDKSDSKEQLQSIALEGFITQLQANHNGHRSRYPWSMPLEKDWTVFEDLIDFSEAGNIKMKWEDLPIFMCSHGMIFISKNAHLFVYQAPYHELLADEFTGWFVSFFYHVNIVNKKGTAGADELFKAICALVTLPSNIELDKAEVIPFINGKILCKTRQFIPYIPEDYITLTLPFNYDPLAPCPLFKFVILQILPDPKKRMKLLAFMSYCLTPSIKIRKSLMCVGMGHNGKSTPVELLARIMGPMARNCSMQSLLEKEDNQVKLRGARMNYSAEIAGSDFKAAAMESMKDIITSPVLKGRELYEPYLGSAWPNLCKHIFSANSLPFSDYMTSNMAFFDRWEIIEYTEFFDPKTDPELFDDIYNNEAVGILIYLLSITDYACIEGIDGRKVREQWIDNGPSVTKFMHDVGIINAESTPVDDFYESYQKWCQMMYNDLAKEFTYKRHTFYKSLSSQGYKIDTKKKYECMIDDKPHYSSQRVIYDIGFDLQKSFDYWRKVSNDIDNRIKKVEKKEEVKKIEESKKTQSNVLEKAILALAVKWKSFTVEDMHAPLVSKISGLTIEEVKIVLDRYVKAGTLCEPSPGQYQATSVRGKHV